MTPYAVLAGYADRTRPLVTQYAAEGWRTELSVASFDNAVAKAANLLRDGLGTAPGSRVSLDLPLHWQVPVWTLAGLSVGAVVGRGLARADVRVVGPVGAAGLAEPAAETDQVVACSCDAFGLPIPGGPPPGATDAADARAHGDRFVPEPAAAVAAALRVGPATVPWVELVGSAGEVRESRVWVDGSVGADELLWVGFVRPLLRRSSVVIASGLPGDRARSVRAAEGVTEDAG